MEKIKRSVGSLETRTRCHPFSEWYIETITKHRWESSLPEPEDWQSHNEAVLDLRTK